MRGVLKNVSALKKESPVGRFFPFNPISNNQSSIALNSFMFFKTRSK